MRKRRPPASSKLLTAQAAASALGVSRRTLYSYVSRGLIGVSKKSVVGRGSLYDAADVEVLRDRKRRGRSHAAIAASTIQFGEPVLETGLTNIEDSHLSYRGHDAVALSEDGTLEDVAGLLWLMPPRWGPRKSTSGHLWPHLGLLIVASERSLARFTWEKSTRALGCYRKTRVGSYTFSRGQPADAPDVGQEADRYTRDLPSTGRWTRREWTYCGDASS